MANQVILQDCQGERWLRFSDPREIFVAHHHDQVLPKLAQVEKLVNERGLFAAGFISYEAAPAFDRALKVRQAGVCPLLWFGLYDAPQEIEPPQGEYPYSIGEWSPSINWDEYKHAIDCIKELIATGNTYQVNFTFRLWAAFQGDPWGLFVDLIQAQEADFTAYVDFGPVAICSASPELFFELRGNSLMARPMKGTAPRGLTCSQDQIQKDWLYHSEKNRAENVMIVDMIRNDIGRVCEIGSVCVPQLFEVEQYPTLWQMTSTVVGETRAPVANIMEALFPCSSITGAPKVSTMQIIADLESQPRNVYTGCIGYIAPNRNSQFNVAIRTVLIDKKRKLAEYGVGGGIVWDSGTIDEYEECRTKARILFESRPAFRLLESFLWEPEEGYFLLEEHLRRLSGSAKYFGFDLDMDRVRAELTNFGLKQPAGSYKVRLLLDKNGEMELEAAILGAQKTVKVGLATNPIDLKDVFLYHKTTRRQVYEEALASRPDCEDVILWNASGEITEASSANVIIKSEGRLLTPPVTSGLLAGTFRDRLLAERKIREGVIIIEDLWHSEAIYLINSVRRWREAKLIPLGV